MKLKRWTMLACLPMLGLVGQCEPFSLQNVPTGDLLDELVTRGEDKVSTWVDDMPDWFGGLFGDD